MGGLQVGTRRYYRSQRSQEDVADVRRPHTVSFRDRLTKSSSSNTQHGIRDFVTRSSSSDARRNSFSGGRRQIFDGARIRRTGASCDRLGEDAPGSQWQFSAEPTVMATHVLCHATGSELAT